MALISIDRLHPSMTLAADIRGRSGRLLAAQGTLLNEQHLLIFRTWGISEVDILLDDHCHMPSSEAALDESAARLEAATRQLLPQFRINDPSHPLITELLRLAAIRKVSAHEN